MDDPHYAPLAGAGAFISLARYRALTGDAASEDGAVTAALQRYTIFADGYTGRHLARAEHTDFFAPSIGQRCFLRQFPVIELSVILSHTGDEIDPGNVLLDPDTGEINHRGAWLGKRLTVAYEAGYDQAPDDLALAIATLAQGYLSGTHGGIDAIAPARRETVYGVSSVDYALPKDGEGYPELGAFRAVFDRYRRVGMA